MELRRQGEDDVKHVERANGLCYTPGIAAWQVEAGFDGRLAHVLMVAQRSPLKGSELLRTAQILVNKRFEVCLVSKTYRGKIATTALSTRRAQIADGFQLATRSMNTADMKKLGSNETSRSSMGTRTAGIHLKATESSSNACGLGGKN